jgi:hypothetical protein
MPKPGIPSWKVDLRRMPFGFCPDAYRHGRERKRARVILAASFLILTCLVLGSHETVILWVTKPSFCGWRRLREYQV